MEVAPAIAGARALVLAHRHFRQERPEPAQGLRRTALVLLVQLADQEVVGPERLVRERHLGVDLEPARPASTRVALEADVPDPSLAHARLVYEDRRRGQASYGGGADPLPASHVSVASEGVAALAGIALALRWGS